MADLVRESTVLLAGYRSALEYLVGEPSPPGAGMAPRPADAPFPGDAQAFAALMVIWEKVPRLEAALRLAVAGHPGLRRGGSAGNFLAALAAIPALAAGLDEDAEAAAGRILDQLLNLARAVPAIDEAQRWRPLRSRACPYCGCWFLRVLLDARGQPTAHVECFGHDGSGAPCRAVAAMGTDGHGRPVLAWAAGLTETVPDLEESP